MPYTTREMCFVKGSRTYLMDNLEEEIRLEIKTDPDEIRRQAVWCGIKPGMRVLDAGCGPGKTSSILYKMIQPAGWLLGVDYAEQRIAYARKHYGGKSGLDFQLHDLRNPLNFKDTFDLIWVRFVLEYNLAESFEIVKNLTNCLKPGGALCLMDLDHNCLSHYEMPKSIEEVLKKIILKISTEFNFDPYAGRKLYSYLYDLTYKNINMHLTGHHLIYGKARQVDIFNWTKKIEMVSEKLKMVFNDYPGGHKAFSKDFNDFFLNPRRFSYTPLILCKGIKPNSK